MNEMVERVARAITAGRLAENRNLTDDQRAQQVESFWRAYVSDAKIAISAMREPTQEQYDALCATDKVWRDLTSEIVWKTYINAALKE